MLAAASTIRRSVPPSGGARPLISVIVNSYNYEDYIEQTIESVLAQSFTDYELIVVDDGSKDRSVEILQQYSHRATIVLQENQGQVAACWRGLELARGEFVQFLDSDDYLLPGALEAVAQALGPEVSKVQFQLLPVGPSNEPLGPAFPPVDAGSSVDLVARINACGCYVSPPNSGNVYRRSLFELVGRVDYEPSIDGAPYLLAPFLGEVVQIPRPLGCYRYHARNFSGHGAPRPEQFSLAVDRFIARLAHLERILTAAGVGGLKIQHPEDFAFIHLHRLFEAVVDGRRPAWSSLCAYLRSQAREERSLKRRLAFAAFSLLLAIAPDRVRRRLVVLRTDPTSRPGRRAPGALSIPGGLIGFLAHPAVAFRTSRSGRFGAQASTSRSNTLQGV